MNGHLFTYWLDQKKVECACGWKRKARGRASAMRQHLAHVVKKWREPITAIPKLARVPFVTAY